MNDYRGRYRSSRRSGYGSGYGGYGRGYGGYGGYGSGYGRGGLLEQMRCRRMQKKQIRQQQKYRQYEQKQMMKARLKQQKFEERMTSKQHAQNTRSQITTPLGVRESLKSRKSVSKGMQTAEASTQDTRKVIVVDKNVKYDSATASYEYVAVQL